MAERHWSASWRVAIADRVRVEGFPQAGCISYFAFFCSTVSPQGRGVSGICRDASFVDVSGC